MSIASDAVVGLRERWATRFIDSGTLTRETGIGTFNDTTGQYDTPSSSLIWDGFGECLIRPKSRTTSDFAETEVDVEQYDIFVRHTATGAKPGDKFLVTGSVYDPDLVGATLVLTEVIEDSYLTKYQWVATRIKS